MSVLFIDYGRSANKKWEQLHDSATWENWCDALKAQVSSASVEREGQSIRFLVHHAPNDAEWDALQKAIERALSKGLRPPFALRVSSSKGEGSVSLSGWACVSSVAVPSDRSLSHLRPRFQRLAMYLEYLATAPADPTSELLDAWAIWNKNRPSLLPGDRGPTRNSGPQPAPPNRSTFERTMIAVALLGRTWLDAQGRSDSIRKSVDQPNWWWRSQGLSQPPREMFGAVETILADKVSTLADSPPDSEITSAIAACPAIKEFSSAAARGALSRDLVEAMLGAVSMHHRVIAAA